MQRWQFQDLRWQACPGAAAPGLCGHWVQAGLALARGPGRRRAETEESRFVFDRGLGADPYRIRPLARNQTHNT